MNNSSPPADCFEKKMEISLTPSDELKNILNDTTLIGEVINLNTISALPALIKDCGMPFGKLHYYGGLHVIISFQSSEDAEAFLANKECWECWFQRMIKGTNSMDICLQRVAIVRVIGLPLQFRSISNIIEIAANYGRVLDIEDDAWDRLDLSYYSVLILTEYMTKLNESINIRYEGKTFKVGMVECDKRWHPLENSDNNSVTSNHETDKIEEDDKESVSKSDGISDSWRNNCNDVHDSYEEEGEIREDVHSGGSSATVEAQEEDEGSIGR
ncbi:hypothetical protein L1887_36749 [Cichorium endivia]|nr:hypothetical protein L1887_36749 [Cichorium endivia]